MIVQGYLFSLLYGAVCILVGVLLHKLNVSSKISRKSVHILIGGEWLIIDYFMPLSLHFLAVCLIFTSALIVEYRLKLLPAMSSSGDNAPGTVWYGVAMTTLAAVQLLLPELRYPFGIAVFCTSVGDGFAALIGQSIRKYNPKLLGDKTLLGTLTVLIASTAVALIFTGAASLNLSVYSCLALGILAASVELICRKGTDNVAVTLSVALGAYLLSAYPTVPSYAISVAASPLVIGVIHGRRKLTPLGILGAATLALVSAVAFKDTGYVLLLVYFTLALTTDKIKKQDNKIGQSIKTQSVNKPHRTLAQVAENGTAALLSALLYALTHNPIFAVGFVAALGQSLSDTAASGIGALSNRTYDIFRRTPCERGASGGMSILGTLVSLLAPLAFAAVATLMGAIPPLHIITVTTVAFLGTLLDSLLGSLAQGRYLCPICGKPTELPTCCGAPAELIRGSRRITNGTVNLISNILATLAAILLSLIFF